MRFLVFAWNNPESQDLHCKSIIQNKGRQPRSYVYVVSLYFRRSQNSVWGKNRDSQKLNCGCHAALQLSKMTQQTRNLLFSFFFNLLESRSLFASVFLKTRISALSGGQLLSTNCSDFTSANSSSRCFTNTHLLFQSCHHRLYPQTPSELWFQPQSALWPPERNSEEIVWRVDIKKKKHRSSKFRLYLCWCLFFTSKPFSVVPVLLTHSIHVSVNSCKAERLLHSYSDLCLRPIMRDSYDKLQM